MMARYFFTTLGLFQALCLVCFFVSEYLFTMFQTTPYARLACIIAEWIAMVFLTGYLVNVKWEKKWYRSDFSVYSMMQTPETEEEADARRLRQAKENHRLRKEEKKKEAALEKQRKKEEKKQEKERRKAQPVQEEIPAPQQPVGSFLHSADDTDPLSMDEVNALFSGQGLPEKEPKAQVQQEETVQEEKKNEPAEEHQPRHARKLSPVPVENTEPLNKEENYPVSEEKSTLVKAEPAPIRKEEKLKEEKPKEKHSFFHKAKKKETAPEEKQEAPGSIVHQADNTLDLSRNQLEDLFAKINGSEESSEDSH